jgi:hypothetical protein
MQSVSATVGSLMLSEIVAHSINWERERVHVTRNKKLAVTIVAAAAIVLSMMISQASVASAAGLSDDTSSMWMAKFTWKQVPVPAKCPKTMGRTYTFALQSRPSTGYLTAESKLRLRVERPNGKMVVRKYELMFGDGDLVWMPTIGPREKIKRATVVASGQGVMPRKRLDVYCGIVMP